jgi:hypothetical protein
LYERFNLLEEYLEFLLQTKQTNELHKYVAQRDPFTLKLALSISVKTQQDEAIVRMYLDKAKMYVIILFKYDLVLRSIGDRMEFYVRSYISQYGVATPY